MRLLPLMLLAACAYDAPVDTPLDAEGNPIPVLNTITGEVTADVDAPSTTILFLTPADNPMPPEGTGLPITFTSVPDWAFTGPDAGLQAAPFTFTNVPDGTYQITALMDMDDDFHPLVSALGGATCGDVVGAHLDSLTTQTVGEVTVQGGTLLDDVSVLVAQPMQLERPAFGLHGFGANTGDKTDATVNRAEAAANALSQMFTVDATGVHSAIYDLNDPGAETCGVFLPLYGVDADGDGTLDPHPNEAYAAQGLKDVWPRMYLQYLGVPTQADDGSVGFDTSALAEGESWAAEAVPDPTLAIFGTVKVNQVVPETSLQYLWVAGAQHTKADGSVELVLDASQIPAGAWSVTLVSLTGQTWTVPNELVAFPATSGTFDPVSQGTFLTVE